MSFKCAMRGKCKWRVYCVYDEFIRKWLVKIRYRYYSCILNGKCKMFRSLVIVRLFFDKLREDGNLMFEKI